MTQTEPTTAEKTRQLAEQVMGWEFRETYTYPDEGCETTVHGVYLLSDGCPYDFRYVEGFQPCTDANDAQVVIEKATKVLNDSQKREVSTQTLEIIRCQEADASPRWTWELWRHCVTVEAIWRVKCKQEATA
ncbi:MAG: hypothetical protein AAF432_00665 [Planctomycetota bacterium]